MKGACEGSRARYERAGRLIVAVDADHCYSEGEDPGRPCKLYVLAMCMYCVEASRYPDEVKHLETWFLRVAAP